MWKPELLALSALVLFSGCGEEVYPKPRGYFRIDMPSQDYVEVPTPCSIRFEIPTYSKLALKQESSESCFVDVVYPEVKAKLHLTYRPVRENLRELITDVQGFKRTHQVKANRIATEEIQRPDAGVYGNMYLVDGDVASPMVFYLTDSVRNFLYGSLYYSVAPNGDSLAPVTEQLREDIRHLGATLQWTDRIDRSDG